MTNLRDEMNNGQTVTDRSNTIAISPERKVLPANADVVKIKGIIDMYNSSFMEETIQGIRASGAKNLILDFSSVKYVASVGVGMLVMLAEKVEKASGRLVLFGVRHTVREIFSLLGFLSFLEITESEEEATRLLSESSPKQNFPIVKACPNCGNKVKLTKAGRFRCPRCKSIVLISSDAEISAD